MVLDAGLGNGLPWWAFLMMPLMMIGMGLMMWFMMRMMMGMGGHGAPHGSTGPPAAARSEEGSGSEVAVLRRQLAELQQRLAAMESGPGGHDDEGKPPLVAPNEGGALVAGKGEAP